MGYNFRSQALSLCAIAALGSVSFADAPAPIPYRGLSATLPELLRNRPDSELSLGSCRVRLDDLIDANLPLMLDFDQASNDYLEVCEECTYGMLASVIEDSMWNKASDGNPDLFTSVEVSEEGDTVTFSIYLGYDKKDLLPLYIVSEGEEVKVWSALPCSLDLELALTIRVQSDTVLEGRDAEGVSVNIEQFTLRLESMEEVSDPWAAVRIRDRIFRPKVERLRVRGEFAWYLSGTGGDACGDGGVTYKELEAGEYQWSSSADSSLEFSCSMDSGEEDSFGSFEIEAEVFDLANPEAPALTLRTPEETRTLPVLDPAFLIQSPSEGNSR